jgi:hypothetical protein
MIIYFYFFIYSSSAFASQVYQNSYATQQNSRLFYENSDNHSNNFDKPKPDHNDTKSQKNLTPCPYCGKQLVSVHIGKMHTCRSCLKLKGKCNCYRDE